MSVSERPTFVELFTPKLVTVLREGYDAAALKADAAAGLTVAIVALPLSMAIAIASGLSPQNGLAAAIIGGFLVSALGGSRFQIGGPAGAFIVLVSAAVARHSVDGMLLATMLAGAMLIVAGLLRLGAYVRLIPYPVTLGFTAGIAVIIFVSQIKDLFGLMLGAAEKGPVAEKLLQDGFALSTFNAAAACVALATIAVIVAVRRLRPQWPGILIAVALSSVLVAVFGLDVETIRSQFGALPRGLPPPRLPALSLPQIASVLPDAFAFALLGAIESLLSATVADGMTGRRHRANCELVGQGAANIAAGLFGAMVVTGAIARTATNVRAGARGPVAGMFHAAFLFLFMAAAGPLAAYAPLPALAAVLAVIAWNMIERHAILRLVATSHGDALALVVTFALTVFRDLTTGIVAGVAVGALAFLKRLSDAAALEGGRSAAPLLLEEDRADPPTEGRVAYAPKDDGVAIYRIKGALFFGSAASLGAALERVLAGERAFILDFEEASVIDTSGANAVRVFVDKARRLGVRVIVSGGDDDARRALAGGGVDATVVGFAADLDTARKMAESAIAPSATTRDTAAAPGQPR